MANFIDRVIEFASPGIALKRQQERNALNVLRKYEAAGSGPRMDGWNAPSTSQNNEAEYGLRMLRNRSHQLVRDNPYASRAIQGIANNMVGAGIRPSLVGTDSAKKTAKKVWDDWAGKVNCDWDELQTFYGIQKLVIRTVAESGEAIVLRRRTNNPLMPIQLQVVEPDFLDSDKYNGNTPDGGFIFMGVEFDGRGKRKGYWLFDKHPSDHYQAVSRFVPAADVLHIYEILRPGQVRGVPFGVSSFVRLRDFDEYEDAQLLRQKIAACFSVFIQTANDTLPGKIKQGANSITERVEPGMIYRGAPGDTVTFGAPPPAEGYDSYSRKILQSASTGYGATYEMVTGDLSNVNFSSGRMGWLEFQRNIEVWQEHMIVPMLCNKVWDWFIEAGYMAGSIRTTNVTATWTSPRREMIDPWSETRALQLQVQSGFISLSESLRLRGYDPKEVLEELAGDMRKLDELGLKLTVDGRLQVKPDASTGTQNASADSGVNGA